MYLSLQHKILRKPIAGKIDFKSLNWQPIRKYDRNRDFGSVYLRSQHYSDIKKVPCRLVKLCHAAEEFAEVS